jgi:hypothetical protein
MHRFGGMITIHLDSDLAGTRRFLEHTKLFTLAESLGGVKSLIEHPALMAHGSIPAEQRAGLGIDDTLLPPSTLVASPLTVSAIRSLPLRWGCDFHAFTTAPSFKSAQEP